MSETNPSTEPARDELLSLSDLRALTRSARELAEEIGLETLLERILNTVATLTDSPESSVLLKNPNKDELYFAAAKGPAAQWLMSSRGPHSQYQVPIQGSKAGAVYISGTSQVENAVREHFAAIDQETKSVTQRMVCVPLTVGAERLGVMQAQNKTSGDYDERDRELLEHFANLASVAIRNAQLLETALAHCGLFRPTMAAEELIERMNEVRRDARSETLTILFADMRGFTQFCQSLIDPKLVQARLSEFISLLSGCVLDEDGTVNKFLGDGLLALFQGEATGERAVRCAFAMIKKFDAMRANWDENSNQQLDFLDLGIGITTDQVIIGGIGSGPARDYTVIGSAVNFAAALEKSARDGKRIICDKVTYNQASALVDPIPEPENFLLKKPGQEVGVRFKSFAVTPRNAKPAPRIFVSHSHKDRDYVETLIQELKENGLQTWYSVADIEKGALWTAEIRKAIARCNWMIVIVSKNSAHSKWINHEVDLAMAAPHLHGHILPIAIDDTPPADVSQYLAALQSIFTNTTDNVAEALTQHFKST